MIEIENLGKKVGSKNILHDINLKVAKGEVLGLIGPNGAGKTTLLSLLSTTQRLDVGEIRIDGYSMRKEIKEIRKKIGYVPQEIALYSTLTVLDNLNFWGEMSQTKNKRARIMEVVSLLSLEKFSNEKMDRLSGGYKRRVNIAAALLHHPEILLMDEPTVGMDIYSKQELLPFLKNLSKKGTTIIYTSHDVEELLYLSDRIAMLDQGKLVFDGSLEEGKKKIEILQGVTSSNQD